MPETAIGRRVDIMKALILASVGAKLRGLKRASLSWLRDSHTIPQDCPKPSLSTLAWRTVRYRVAGVGISFTENERRLAHHRNRHKAERVFIMGNGPSLNLCDLRLLKNEITFGVNSIFLNYEKMGFHPTYYVVEDVFVAEDRAEEINAYHGSVKFFGNYLKYCLLDSDDTLWLNVRFRYDEYPGFPHFSRNALRMVWTGGTVTYVCLQLAYYMGFSEVYLIGFDHSYTIPSDAQVSGTAIMSASDDPNHFHPDYFGKGYRWHDPKVDRMEKAYRRAKEVFESDGRRICNATVGGKLEVFERVDYSSLF
ncbi:6-hydroxymethylpterin diphosphokinase MptE-like protein [Candidatus Poribacteria bacterium]